MNTKIVNLSFFFSISVHIYQCFNKPAGLFEGFISFLFLIYYFIYLLSNLCIYLLLLWQLQTMHAGKSDHILKLLSVSSYFQPLEVKMTPRRSAVTLVHKDLLTWFIDPNKLHTHSWISGVIYLFVCLHVLKPWFPFPSPEWENIHISGKITTNMNKTLQWIWILFVCLNQT